jgi:hypothetical protein
MVVPWSLLAEAGGVPKSSFLESPLLWTSLALVGVLLLGALIIALVDRWRKRPVQTTSTDSEQLSHWRTLYQRGEISREEFERLRTLLGGRLRERLQIPPKAEGSASTGQQPAPPGEPPAEPPPPAPPGAFRSEM